MGKNGDINYVDNSTSPECPFLAREMLPIYRRFMYPYLNNGDLVNLLKHPVSDVLYYEVLTALFLRNDLQSQKRQIEILKSWCMARVSEPALLKKNLGNLQGFRELLIESLQGVCKSPEYKLYAMAFLTNNPKLKTQFPFMSEEDQQKAYDEIGNEISMAGPNDLSPDEVHEILMRLKWMLKISPCKSPSRELIIGLFYELSPGGQCTTEARSCLQDLIHWVKDEELLAELFTTLSDQHLSHVPFTAWLYVTVAKKLNRLTEIQAAYNEVLGGILNPSPDPDIYINNLITIIDYIPALDYRGLAKLHIISSTRILSDTSPAYQLLCEATAEVLNRLSPQQIVTQFTATFMANIIVEDLNVAHEDMDKRGKLNELCYAGVKKEIIQSAHVDTFRSMINSTTVNPELFEAYALNLIPHVDSKTKQALWDEFKMHAFPEYHNPSVNEKRKIRDCFYDHTEFSQEQLIEICDDLITDLYSVDRLGQFLPRLNDPSLHIQKFKETLNDGAYKAHLTQFITNKVCRLFIQMNIIPDSGIKSGPSGSYSRLASAYFECLKDLQSDNQHEAGPSSRPSVK